MDELKEIYGIEMGTTEMHLKTIEILSDELDRTIRTLDRASNPVQRVEALKRQEAIKWAAKTLQKGTR